MAAEPRQLSLEAGTDPGQTRKGSGRRRTTDAEGPLLGWGQQWDRDRLVAVWRGKAADSRLATGALAGRWGAGSWPPPCGVPLVPGLGPGGLAAPTPRMHSPARERVTGGPAASLLEITGLPQSVNKVTYHKGFPMEGFCLLCEDRW